MTKIAKEITNKKQVRAAVAEGGWDVVWGELLDEYDALLFAISIPTGSIRGWIAQQVQTALGKPYHTESDVSDDAIVQGAG
jgi:hypothetical protein